MKSSLSSEYIRIGRTVSIGEMPVCLGAGEHFDRALQACLTLANTSTGPCKPAWSWRTLRRGPASLLDAGEHFDEALQACLTLIYGKSSPNFLAPTETGGESRKIRQPAYPGSIIRPLPGPSGGRMQFAPTYYTRQIWQASLTPLTHRPADCQSLAQRHGGG